MQDHELDAWLAGETVTDDQRARLLAADAAIADVPLETWDETDRALGFTAAAEAILGDTDLDILGAEFDTQRIAAATAQSRLYGAIAAALAEGELSQSEIARRARVDRMTVRKIAGKR